MDLKISDIIKNITIVSILMGCFGILIRLINLQSYNFPFYESINTNVIFIGFIFSIIVIAHAFIHLSFIDFHSREKNNIIKVIFLAIIKIILSSLILCTVFNIINLNELAVGYNQFINKILSIGIVTPFFIIGMLGIGVEYLKEKSKYSLIIFKIPICIFISLSVITFTFLLFTNPIFKEVLRFELYFGFLILIFLIGMIASEKDNKKGIKSIGTSFFSNDKESRNILDKAFFYFYILLVIIIVLSSYSKNVYKYIDINSGGGKFSEQTIIRKGEIIKGKLIINNEKYLILESDSSLIRIDWSDLDKINIKK